MHPGGLPKTRVHLREAAGTGHPALRNQAGCESEDKLTVQGQADPCLPGATWLAPCPRAHSPHFLKGDRLCSQHLCHHIHAPPAINQRLPRPLLGGPSSARRAHRLQGDALRFYLIVKDAIQDSRWKRVLGRGLRVGTERPRHLLHRTCLPTWRLLNSVVQGYLQRLRHRATTDLSGGYGGGA